jgi:hypothetical protein
MGTEIKIGVERGGGSWPGYLWDVWLLPFVYDEATGFLSCVQYRHARMQVQELAREKDPTHPLTASVDAIEDFHELRDSGGILGGINLRIFFYLDKPKAALVVLGSIKKQNNGPTPLGDRRRMARRKRNYLSGEYSGP